MPGLECTGQVALVIGGSKGIGAAVVSAFCDAGAHVAFTYPPSEDPSAATALMADIGQRGGSVEAAAVNAVDAAATTAMVDRVAAERGRLDAVVFNVGRNRECPLTETTDEAWKTGIELNLGAAFYAVRPALPHMLRAGYGKIVFIGSSATFDGGGGCPEYASAKSGLVGLMAYLSRVYARKGVRTNVVHPAVIDTDLLRVRYPDEEAREKLASQIPVGRLGRPEDIAGIVLFLASPMGDYVCGQEILADGGRTLFGR